MKNITILGRFGFWNIWDDTILFNEINLLKEKFPNSQITVFSWNPNFIKSQFLVDSIYLPPIMWYRLYKFLNIFYLIKFFKLIKNTDLFILWWWWFFSDRQYFAISGWLRYCKLAKYFWAKVIWFWMWAWPFFYKFNKNLIKKSSKVFDFISIRDKESLNNLLNSGFNKNKLIQTIDPAFFSDYKNEKKDNSIWFILHQENEKYIIEQVNKILKTTNYNIKFIITDFLDLYLNKRIIEKIWNNRCKLIAFNNVDLIIREISSCDFIISQRLHWSIISFTQKVPFLNIYYHHKWKELINLLWINDFSINIENISNKDFLHYINKKNDFVFKSLNLLEYKLNLLWKI